MKRMHLFVTVMLASLLLTASGTYLPPSSAFVTRSQTETKEVKVWVNTNSGVYHCPGTRWYGRGLPTVTAETSKDVPKQDEKAPAGTPSTPDHPSEVPTKGVPNGLATISVSSNPDGADIYTDDAFVGNTPATLKTQCWEAHDQSHDGGLQGLVTRNYCTTRIGSPFDSGAR